MWTYLKLILNPKNSITLKTNTLYEPLLLEIAWEVCNKVGGIYTVIQSKTPYIIKRWQNQYCVLGPVLNDKIPI